MNKTKAVKIKKVKKIILSKYGTKYGPKIGRVAWKEGDDRYINFYSGEFLNGKPHGKGICEKYHFEKLFSNTYKSSRFDNFWKKYSKHFMHKCRGYFLWKKYIGEWKFGKRDGYCEYIGYGDPYSDYTDTYVNRDGSPIIFNKKIGNFKNNKEHGKFEIFDNLMGWASINYKNGRVIGNPVKMKKKLNLNTNEYLKNYSLEWKSDAFILVKKGKTLWLATGDDDF